MCMYVYVCVCVWVGGCAWIEGLDTITCGILLLQYMFMKS